MSKYIASDKTTAEQSEYSDVLLPYVEADPMLADIAEQLRAGVDAMAREQGAKSNFGKYSAAVALWKIGQLINAQNRR